MWQREERGKRLWGSEVDGYGEREEYERTRIDKQK
jgi:hypothetical protein